MDRTRLREIAKFFCGAEAFHSLVHAYLFFSNTPLTVLGFTAGPTWNMVAVIVNAAASLVLGVYAWKPYGQRLV